MNAEDRPAAVIQGASRGVGLALVEQLLAGNQFDNIVATCRAPAEASDLDALCATHPERLRVVALDVTDEASIAAATDSLARDSRQVSLLVNCAGLLHADDMQPERRLSDLNPDNLLRAFAVNAAGPLLVTKHVSRLFDRQARTVVANISARVGSIGDNHLGGWYAYRGSKAAQNMFTRTLAIELRRKYRGAICIALHPGTVDTDLSAPFSRRVPAGKLFTRELAARQLLGVIDALETEDNGGFFAWDGNRIPW